MIPTRGTLWHQLWPRCWAVHREGDQENTFVTWRKKKSNNVSSNGSTIRAHHLWLTYGWVLVHFTVFSERLTLFCWWPAFPVIYSVLLLMFPNVAFPHKIWYEKLRSTALSIHSLFFLSYVWVFCLRVYIWAPHMCSTQWGRKRISVSQDLQPQLLWLWAHRGVAAGKLTIGLSEEQQVLTPWAISLAH